jgi:hypothetical protein
MTIKVHVLNFHSVFSHIEIVLENTDISPHKFYGINRWETPGERWSDSRYKNYIWEAGTIFSFDIEADPQEIVNDWRGYWTETDQSASILGNNCAVAAQWFLKKFAKIDNPSISNVSWNHLALGIIWPSFIPCPITLPGRIMSNVQFHVDAKNNNITGQQYSRLFLYISMALATLVFAISVFALTVAVNILTGGLATFVAAVAVGVNITSTYGFFKANNALNAKNTYEESHSNSIEIDDDRVVEDSSLIA